LQPLQILSGVVRFLHARVFVALSPSFGDIQDAIGTSSSPEKPVCRI